MKCPKCSKVVTTPASDSAMVQGKHILVLSCPHCEAILGAVNK